MNLRNLIYATAAAVLLLTVGGGCDLKPARYITNEGATWGTIYHITYRSSVDLSDSIRAVMRQVELSLSPFDSLSTISAINRGEEVRVDSMLALVFAESQRVNRLSGGAFDPTVATLVDLWGFGRKKDVTTEPSQAAIDSALLTVGIDRCGLTDGLLVKCHPATRFDFSAITKGYGCDAVGAMLRRNGVTDYMVEIGGEIALSGINPKGKPWLIMIDAPIECDTAITHDRMATMSVSDCGIATSGNYRNYRDYGTYGRVGHTISPTTGYPVPTHTLSATVIAPTAMLADALATACMAMDPDKASAMIERIDNASALLAVATPDSIRLISTSRFPSINH